MATAVVALDLRWARLPAPSDVLLALAGLLWLALLVTGGLFRPVAGIPATAALGSALAAHGRPLWPLLVLAALLWAWRLPRLVRAPARVTGTALLPVVATQSLAVLATDLAWPAALSLGLLCAGALGYVGLIARFDAGEVGRGDGEQWIAGGAAAISALACATLARAIGSGPLADASVAAWIVALAWLPALAAGELRRPRPGRIGTRWSTVFPLGMYAAMSFAVARAAHLSAARAFARGWTAVAALAWLVVAAAALAQARRS
jgi:hypothetical protein